MVVPGSSEIELPFLLSF